MPAKTAPAQKADGAQPACEGPPVCVEEHLGLVHAFARRFLGRGVDYDDLYSAGCVGLVKAAQSFDPARGFAFSTYAVPVILGEIKRLFRDDGTVKVSRRLKELYRKSVQAREEFCARQGREPTVSELAEQMGISCEQLSEVLAAGTPALSLTKITEEGGGDYELPSESIEEEIVGRVALQQALSTLEENDRRLLSLRYQRGLSQQDTARILGMTQVQVSRRERKLLAALRERMA